MWLTSFPKSGNTFVRTLLATYFFSEDGIFNFELLKNIKQFPQPYLFYELGIDIGNRKELAKNFIKAQEIINQKPNLQFWKTHFSFCKIDNHSFTDLKNSLGAIYLVRDPRDVVLSYAHHNDQTIEETLKFVLENHILGVTDKKRIPIYMGSWAFHYNSWKAFKSVKRYKLIKYEDLIKNTESIFIEILDFIKKLSNSKFEINIDKVKKVIETTSFERLKKLEKKQGFSEAKKDKMGNIIPFFREGKKEQWKKSINIEIKSKIELICEKEMKELGYL